MLKLSKLNETIFGDMIKRSYKEDEVRKEDQFKTNIKDMKEVDLGDDFPVLFADIDLIYNGYDEFDRETTEYIIESLKGTGWRLPYGFDEMTDLFLKSTYPHRWNNELTAVEFTTNDCAKIISVNNGNELVFDLTNKHGQRYWCENEWKPNEHNTNTTSRGFYVGNPVFQYGCLINGNNYDNTDKCRIRLIKDK